MCELYAGSTIEGMSLFRLVAPPPLPGLRLRQGKILQLRCKFSAPGVKTAGFVTNVSADATSV